MKKLLLAEKEKLEGDLAGLQQHEELGEDLDSSVQEIENDEASQDMIADIQGELAKVNKALSKIDAGTYGSDDQGQPLSEQRLRALPWADKAA